MKKKFITLLLALTMVFETIIFSPLPVIAEDETPSTETQDTPEQDNKENYIQGMVSLTCNGEKSVDLQKGDKLYAKTSLDPSLGDMARYAWEIMTDTNRWATVSGYVFSYAIITEALLANAMTVDGAAQLRCIVTVDEKEYVSDILTVTLPTPGDASLSAEADIPAAAVFSMRSTAAAEGSAEEESSAEEETTEAPGDGDASAATAFQIVVTYTFYHPDAAPGLNLHGMPAANTYTVTLPPKTDFSGTVVTPLEIGYMPYVKLEQLQYVAIPPAESEYVKITDKTTGVIETFVPAHSIEFVDQAKDVTVHVYFLPQEVTYRVRIYEQNLYNDEYTLVDTITKIGIANTCVGEGHDTSRTGFSPLYYDPDTSIDEDGSFALDIYYDRIYYLVDLNLNDTNDAYGAVNHFVRYKTPVVLPTAKRPGHSFVNWTLDEVKNDRDKDDVVTSHNYPQTAAGGHTINSVEHNLYYTANWKVETTSYTVIYWLENVDDDGFTLDSFKVVTGATPGDTVSAKDDLAISDASCFTFSDELSDKNVVVSSDGTTAVNAYYLRKYYTMSFVGNASCITKEHVHTNECYARCELENHTHTEACGLADLVCGKEEHIHTEAHTGEGGCCDIEEHIHTTKTSENEGCCTIPYHVHGTGSSSDCTKTEHTVHHDECYSRNDLKDADTLTDNNQKKGYTILQNKIEGPLNGYVYRVRVTKNSTIYNFLYAHNHWFYLGTNNTYNGVTATGISNPASAAESISSAKATTICGLELHTHGDGTCDCPITEHDHTSGCTCPLTYHAHGEGDCNYVCGKESHVHNVDCYTHQCGKTAHAHTANCVRDCQTLAHTHSSSCQNTKDSNTFLQFKAKYNADISHIWRTVWEKFPNGERWSANTYFSQVLVYLPFMPPANITFTKNTTTVTKLYNISYYLEALGTTEITYDNRYFELNNTVNAKYNYLTPDEDFFDILGFTQYKSNPAFSNNQISTNNGGPVALYYKRNEYDLEFVSLGTTLSTFTKTLKYQQPIDSSMEVPAKNVPYPSNKEEGAIRFVGWYTTPNCAVGTEFSFDGNTTMPVGGLVLYAKWEACSYTVNVYSNEKMEERIDTQTVPFDSFIKEPNYLHIQHPGLETLPDGTFPDGTHPDWDDKNHMIFAGWYYKVNGEEKRFDFNTMSVKFDMEIYAKWTSRIPVNFKIHYVYFDGTKEVEIAPPTVGASLAGTSKHFEAKVDSELNDKYQTGYFPDVRSHTMIMDSDETQNVFKFMYTTAVEKVSYTVTHVFTDSIPEGAQSTFQQLLGGNNTLSLTMSYTIEGATLASHAASVAVSFREGVTKSALVAAVKKQYGIELSDKNATTLWTAVTQMSPDYFIQDLILTINDAENNAVFKWGISGEKARYQIIYYKESVDGTEFLIDRIETAMVKAGTNITAEVTSIEHFKFDEARSKTSGTATALTTDPNTGGLTQGLVLSVYYTRNEYTYYVHHKQQDTNASLEVVEGKAKYGQIVYVADLVKEFPGYVFAPGNETQFMISNDEMPISLYYKGLTVNYVYQVLGMGATIKNSTGTVTIGGDSPAPRTLELWNDGYFLNAWYYSIGDGEREPVPVGWLSDDNTVISLPDPTPDQAGLTIYVFAEVMPTTRRFSVAGYASVENTPQAFVFNLVGKAGTPTEHINSTFIIFDTGHTDISYLPYGEYTLTTLNWAWRVGRPLTVEFNGNVQDASSGTVALDLDTTGEVIITYPGTTNDQWLSDDVSGHIPLLSKEGR